MFDVEGLIAVSSPFRGLNHPKLEYRDLKSELFHDLIDAYKKVLPNLKIQTDNSDKLAYLRSIVVIEQLDNRFRGFGKGKRTLGSKLYP